MNDVLQQVLEFAEKAHGEQMRKFVGERYIAHPIRVMEICRTQTPDVAILAAALLHDVLEDTPVEKPAMLAFLRSIMPEATAQRTLDLVVDLTDIYTKHNYPDWNRRKRKSKEIERLAAARADAQTVKYADIIDNSAEVAFLDSDFADVFLRECRALLKVLTKGNKALYERAVETVEAGIRHLEDGEN